MAKVSRGRGLWTASLLIVAGAAGAGCGDITGGSENGTLSRETGETTGVRATLDLSGGDLRVTLRNGAVRDARVSLSVFVHTPVVNSKGELGTVTVPAGDTVEHVIAASELKGFDVANSAWVRTELEYDYDYDDGIQYRRMTGVAARGGVVVPAGEAIAKGLALADIPIGQTEISTRALGTFKVCFKDKLVFNHANGFSNHGLPPFDLSVDSQVQPMAGQFFYAYYNGQIKGGGNVGTDGCASVTRQTTGAETWQIQPIHYVSSGQTNILALHEDGSSPAQYKFTINVSSTGTVTLGSPSPSTGSVVTYTTGSEDALMQAALFLASNTLNRARAIGVMEGAQVLTLMPTEPTLISHYCDTVSTTQDCPSALTIRLAKTRVVNGINTTDANDREVIAHETGHFIHHMNLGGLPAGSYDYSDSDAAPLNPNESASCPVYRSASPTTGEGIHDLQSIEWQPAAHNEGIANFFAAVAYNPVVKGGACNFRGANCEKPGMSLDSCTEGTSSALFHVTGVEMDWTKMLWDFVTDKGGDMNTFFAAERQITNEGGWPSDGRGNVYDTIQSHLNAINPDMKRKLYDSAGGNIWDGTPDFVCNSSTGIPVFNADGTGYCCPLSCGTCGGSGCGSRPGGSNACCTAGIAAADKSCAPNAAPCLIRNASVIGGP